jgi:hypothetical protein
LVNPRTNPLDWIDPPHAEIAPFGYFGAALPRLNIQLMPNLSVSIPKRAAQNVSCKGIVILPLSPSAAKYLSTSWALSQSILMEKLLPW